MSPGDWNGPFWRVGSVLCRHFPAEAPRKPAWLAVVLALALGGPALGQQPVSHLGSDACLGCHPAQSAAQALSGHAGSLARPWDHRLVRELTSAVGASRGDGNRPTLRIEGRSARLASAAEGRPVAARIDWAFGAGEQAVTFVGQVDRDWYLEHRWSYYPAVGQLALTPGHPGAPPPPEAKAGIRYRVFSPGAEILNCFACHSTGPLQLGAGYEIVPTEPGVHCEACHGGAAEHVQAAAAGDEAGALASVRRLGGLSAASLSKACGACHRPPQSNPDDIDWEDPWNVRHQPVYLGRSSCFRSGEGLSCVTCHDPHGPLSRLGPASYNARCMACHAEGRVPAPACPPAAEAACSTCHMPKVQPQAELAFTNHWIGVYAPEAPLQPRRGSAASRREP